MRRPETAFATPSSLGAAQKLGRAVRLARLARNLTQVDFAERSRISLATLNRIERGAPAVSFTSWLSALETASLLSLLERLADPDADARGRVQRSMEVRKRASGRKSKAARKDDYAF